VQLADVAAAWRAVAATRSRNAKTELVAAALRAAGDDLAIAVAWLAGDLRQRRTGVGWAMLRGAPPPAAQSTLSLHDADAVFEQVAALSGPGSTTERRRRLHALFAAATADEQALLRGLISGELRQGALDAVVVEALARTTQSPSAQVRRAVMLSGAIAPVAEAVIRHGPAALADFGLRVGRPILPMLAATAPSVTDALTEHGAEAAVETKYDGVRVQVHRDGGDIAVFSRSLDDMTGRVPEIVAAVAGLTADRVILDGEALAVTGAGRPMPFQQTGARAATHARPSPIPLSLFAFDVLHLDGVDLIDAPLTLRREALVATAPGHAVPQLVTADPVAAESFAAQQLESGHEGVVVKSVTSSYDAGRRGAAWLKVKPVRTVDLVVLAVEWGHGRRTGMLSNLHLGARDPQGGFVMVGKTFKGMTDDMLRWQTARFLELESHHDDWTVHVAPVQVVEIGFDGVQRSTRYPGGVALRFARVLRYRDDKAPADADTIEALQHLLP
jgi:DNA ligase-1